ncbi:PAS domain S-box protein [Spirosoma sp. 209]|uniref:PAS domain S-box protein n=1 Tax=Spirosoma sp. 209 TaxID=1955701 RepID=UPI00098D6100|nr:PAS domain S-box protein [Spirosoma sp. 209]
MLIPPNEKKRLEALHQYQILDTLPEKTFDRLTELASLICQTPISLLSLVDENRLWVKSYVGIETQEADRDTSFCQYTILDTILLEIEDTHLDTRFQDSPLVVNDPYLRFYAGYPLIDPDGYSLGALCVLDNAPRKLTEDQRKALQTLAEMATELLIENRQKQEQVYLNNLFTLSNDLICVAGTDGYFKRLNPAFSHILGWDEAYLLQTSFADLVHPDDVQSTQQEINRLAAGNPTVNFSHRFRCQDGSYRNLQWVATPEPGTGSIFAIARDVTNEKRKEQQLFQSESKFRSFFENSQGFMCIHDLEGRFLTVNTAGAQALGYQPDELIGGRLHDIVPKHHHEKLNDYLTTIRDTGQANGIMHTHHKDGSLLIWLFNNTLEKELSGDVFVIGNAIDITRRHQLEVDLKWTQHILEQTNEVARIGTWSVDMVKNTIDWSRVTRAIHEVPDDYKPTFETAVNFFEGPQYLLITEALNRAIQQGISYDIELQIVTATGRTVWVRTVGTPEFEGGVCKRLYGTFQDIDDKKRAEQALMNEKSRLSAFVEHAPAAVAMFDRSVRYIAVSNRWMEDYQLTESVIGRSHYDVFPNISDAWKALHARCIEGAVEKNDEDVWRPNGWNHDQYLRWEVRPWYQFDGSIGGIMMFTQDITEACQQRDELRKAKLLAEQASMAKSEFLANMSHEIRTPLNGVIGFTDLVLKTSLNATQHQYLSIVSQSANALLSIINDILDFSKIEAGKLELSVEKVDLYELSSQAAGIITYQAQQKGLEMLLNLPTNLPRFVHVDSVRLKQVLVNLLGNAVKFTERGEIELKIKPLTDSRQPLVTYRFEVRDTGIGIQPEMQERIFEAFSQADPSTTKKYGGTGLGLTISNKLLGLMGSQLQLTSEPGQGSCFFFDIRLKTELGEPILWRDVNLIRKVLIVDDNENNRLILRQMFSLKQIQVDEARNGFDALQLLGQHRQYDVILMDYHMPYMDGIETIEKIRANFPSEQQAIILLHSSSDDERILRASEELAINQRLVKPIKMVELYHALSRLNQQEPKPVQPADNPPTRSEPTLVKVLLVEDNHINQLLAKTIVSRIVPNVQISEALNGLEAVEQYTSVQPDLILMDIQMPLMNGYEATQRIRELQQGRHVPIIALTAGTVKGERERCLAAGMDDFVAKPIVEETIVSVFHKWLRAIPEPARPIPVATPRTTVDHAAHYNPDVIKNLAGQDPTFIRELVEAAGFELRKSLSVLQSSLLPLNPSGIKGAAHKLRGTALSAGMPTLAQQCSTLEQLDTYTDQVVQEHVRQIEFEVNLVLSLMTSAI